MRREQIFEHFEMYVPGAYHHARFMGKSIYLLKIFLLSHVFPLTPRERQNISRLVGYVIHLYSRYFLSAPLATAAPRHDISLWYDLCQYRQHDQDIATAALASVRRHLWYLCPELVVLALFDDLTPAENKQDIAVTLVNIPRPQVFATGKPGQPSFNAIAAKLVDDRPSLAEFVTERSWLLFTLLGAEGEWLYEDPAIWSDYEEYQQCKAICDDLAVVNDAAERAVKDVQDCAQMSRDPQHRDTVILVRSDHRGRVANLRKGNLNLV